MDYFVLRRKCHGPEIERFDAKMTAKKLKQLVNENILNLIKNNADMDKIIPPETEEFDAIRIWIMTNCRMPTGKRIEAIKKNYDNMTWKMFEDFSRENIGSLFEYVIS